MALARHPPSARGGAAAAARAVRPRRSAARAAAAGGAGGAPSEPQPSSAPEAEQKKGLGARVRGFFGGEKLNKERLAKLGTAALLSYGAVSNLNAITLVIIAWCGFGAQTGLSPLAAGQWKAFLAAYTALYAVAGNLSRPLRFTASVAVAPFFDRIVKFFQRRFSVSSPVAFGITVFCVNVCGSFTYLFVGLRCATWITGVPLLP